MISRSLFSKAYPSIPSLITKPFVRPFSNNIIVHTKFIDHLPKDYIPKPTESVPDVETFLKKIGRNSEELASNFESWEQFMTVTTHDLKEKGVDTRLRRYVLAWREKFKRGDELMEIKRGKKRWGGERKRSEVRAKYFGKLKAEERERR